MKKICWFTFLVILSVSCLDDPDCFQLNNDVIGITFRVIGTGKADSTLLKNFSGPGVDKTVTYFPLQLNYFKEQDAFVFEGEKENNFLAIAYTVKNQFVSEDCGSRFVLSELKVLDYDFDSVHVVNATPTKSGGANIDILRCPSTDILTINFNQLYATSNGVTAANRTSKFISHQFDNISSDFSDKVFSGRKTTLEIPVDLTNDSTTFYFTRAGIKDTLTVSYETKTETRYRVCGIQTFVSALKIGENSFDSISYGLNANEEPQWALLDPHTTNLRVYDCPKMNLLQVNFKTSAGAKSVLIKSVTSSHLTGNLLSPAPATVSTLTMPINTESDTSTFYIQYEDHTDTLALQYTRAPVTLFKACGPQMIIRDIKNRSDVTTVTAQVPVNGTSLQFPTIPNVEITVD